MAKNSKLNMSKIRLMQSMLLLLICCSFKPGNAQFYRTTANSQWQSSQDSVPRFLQIARNYQLRRTSGLNSLQPVAILPILPKDATTFDNNLRNYLISLHRIYGSAHGTYGSPNAIGQTKTTTTRPPTSEYHEKATDFTKIAATSTLASTNKLQNDVAQSISTTPATIAADSKQRASDLSTTMPTIANESSSQTSELSTTTTMPSVADEITNSPTSKYTEIAEANIMHSTELSFITTAVADETNNESTEHTTNIPEIADETELVSTELPSIITKVADNKPSNQQSSQNPSNKYTKVSTTNLRPYNSSSTLSNFNWNLFQILSSGNQNKNLIYSPLSLQMLMTVMGLGSRGLTAAQIINALHLPPDSASIQQLFESILQSLPQTDAVKVHMANKMYYSQDVKIASDAAPLQTEFESIDFKHNTQAANNINAWVANKTQNRIQNLIDPSDLSQDTKSILLNAIYFKALWQQPFSTSNTFQAEFENIKGEQKLVAMMTQDTFLPIGYVHELQARVLQLPYENSNISMYILLPNEKQGLAKLQEQLATFDWSIVENSVGIGHVDIRLPKFRIEFEEDMIEPMKKLGIFELFSKRANLKALFPENDLEVSQFRHKAYLDVNEAGSEAAAASFGQLTPYSIPENFWAEHPFMFLIRSGEVVYFIGHVVDL